MSLDKKFVLANIELVKLASICKGYGFDCYFWEDLETWDRWLKIEQSTLQNWHARRKETQDREALRFISGEIKDSQKEIKELENKINSSLKDIPNIPADDVPVVSGTFGELREKLKDVKYAEELFV